LIANIGRSDFKQLDYKCGAVRQELACLFVGCRQEIEEINVKPSVRSTYIFIGTVTAGFIYVFAILVILVKWLFGII